MTDQELKDLIASFAVTHEKSVEAADRRFARLEEQFAKTDAQLAKTDAQLAETDAYLKERFAKTDAQLAETDAQLKRIGEMVGGIANNQGQVAEEFFYRSLASRLQVANIQFDAVYRNLGGKIGGLQDEFDLILVNGDTLAMFEVKTKAHVSLVDTMLQRKIPNLRKVLPYFKDYKIYAGIASLVTYDELIEQAKKQGLFLLTQLGDHVEVVNEQVICF
ncbi:MAG: ABC transporter C-terminal domain-containing protein [Thiotrichaceae bacterium]